MSAVPWVTMSLSVTLTLLAAGVLLWPRAREVAQPPVWCSYEIDNPFDVARSGKLCSLLVVCCLVDDRALDALAELANALRAANLADKLKVLLMLWPSKGGDWFWQQLCKAQVAPEFVRVFIEAARAFRLAGVLRGQTAVCQAEVDVLQEGLSRIAKTFESSENFVDAEIWEEDPGQKSNLSIGRASHVLIRLQHTGWNLTGVLSSSMCGFNVSARLAEANEAGKVFPQAIAVHVVSVSSGNFR